MWPHEKFGRGAHVKATAAASAGRLYDAINARDPQAILNSLSEDFVGEVSSGMPLGVGGRHVGPEAMLQDVWVRVFGAYELTLEIERFLETEDGWVVVLGDYVGRERSNGRAVKARFAHVLSVREDRITSLEQITDTRRWTE